MKTGDFQIDGNGCLTKYTGPGGDVVIPDGVTSIGDEAFANCLDLTSVKFPEGITSIGKSAFSGCWKLNNVVIPDGVTTITDHTFYLCSSLTNITIPSSVTSFGAFPFNFHMLKKMTFTVPAGSFAEEWAKKFDIAVVNL